MNGLLGESIGLGDSLKASITARVHELDEHIEQLLALPWWQRPFQLFSARHERARLIRHYSQTLDD